MIEAIVLENKQNKGRYFAASPELIDWDDENGDVALENIHHAFLILGDNGNKPDETDVQKEVEFSRAHKELMLAKYGPDAIVNFDMDRILTLYAPVNVQLTDEQFLRHREAVENA